MKLTINFSDHESNPLFYALCQNSIPLITPSQWFYEVGKALYNLSSEDLVSMMDQIKTDEGLTVDKPGAKL